MSLRELTLQAVALKVIIDEASARLAIVKMAAQEVFEDTGSTQAPAVLPGGTKVATISLAGGDSQTASVTNEGTFLAWMIANHPEETEVVVRDNAKKKILDAAKKAGHAIDPETGEIIPGIEVRDSRPYVSIRFRPGGADAVADAWLAGELAAIDLVRPRAVEAPDVAA
jgi:hypothetical protein